MTEVLLGEIAEVIRGVTFSKEEGQSLPSEGLLPVIRAGSIQKSLLLHEDQIWVPQDKINEKQKIRANDIVMCTSSGSSDLVGKCAKSNQDFEGSFGAFCVGIRPIISKTSPSYLYHFLNSTNFRNWTKSASGANIKNIRISELAEYKLLLPPIEEQKRIATILDKADSICRKRQKAIKLADEFLRTVFLDMFGDPVTNPKEWEVKPFVEAAPFSPLRNVSVTDDEKVWLLNLDQVESNSGKIISKYICDYVQVGNSTSWFDQSHVLYCKLRPYLNKVVMPDSSGLATSELIPLRPNPTYLNREYLTMYLRSESFVKWATNKVAGAKMPRLSTSELREHQITLPPMNLQNKFSSIYHKIAEIKKKYEMATLACDDGFASLSQKSFSGDL